MEQKVKEITDSLDEIIKFILPHTGDFKKEVKLLSQKKTFFEKIDALSQKYDELLKELEQGK
jgi:mevalonate kinase